ncbi:unnamed protein product [Arctia plantaginis]|uniref:Ionotropic receptor 8a n=1 Tax=Arctia plantaginis TaxID=874455 RepID=A0A8S0YXF7_ARCPL|nr:unnamed protein product [Arctia plantaginis]
MSACYIFLLILLINLGCVISELSLRFVFIIETHEEDLTQNIANALKLAEQARPDLKLDDAIVTLDREREEESYRKLCSAVSRGVSMIIDLSWSPWEMAEELSSATQVPLIRTLLGSQQLVKAIDDHLESRNVTDAAIILESEGDVDRTLYELLGVSHVRVWVHAGLTRDSARALKSMRPEPSFYIIVGQNGFLTDTYKRKKQHILNALIAYISEVYSKLDRELSVITSAVDCDDLEPTMNSTKEKIYRKFAEDADISNETTFYWDADRSGLFLRSRFILSNYKPESSSQVVATWSSNEEYKLLPDVELEPLRMFFRIGTAVAIPWTLPKLDPQSGEQMFNEDGQPLYEGYCIDLMQRLSEVRRKFKSKVNILYQLMPVSAITTMLFDYEIVSPKSGDFGKKLPNGTWDGVVGDLMRGETDIAISALTMTAEREEVIDFVAPYFEQTGILIAIRKPIRKTSLFKFMTVLRTEVWLSIVAALVLTGFMIWLLDKYSPYSARNNPDAYPYPCREFTLKESFWFALTSFTPQGGGEAPKALSGRTLVAAYWLFVVLMLATFTANLAAFLTVERMQTPVSSLEQLARQSRINYTVVEGSSVHQYFINMKFAEDTLYRVWKEITLNATSDQAQYRVWDYPIREQYGHILLAINASGPVPDAKTGFQQVNEHTDADFAFIHDSAEIKYEVTRNCNLTEVGEVFAEQPYAIAVQQGSRLQEDLSRALLELQKERFLEQLASKYWNESARQACPDADESEGITLESLGGVFIATLFGLGLAMITLAWEVFYYKRKEKNKIQTVKPKPEQVTFGAKNTLETKVVESVTKLRRRAKIGKRGNITKNVTIGDKFRPVAEKGVSYINVFPKDYMP